MRGRLSTVLTIALLAASLPPHATAAEAPWTAVTPALPRPENLDPAGLSDVAAVSTTDIWAVGDGWSDTQQPLIAHWTGAGWDPVEEPPVPNLQYSLSAVDALSTRDVWAVGSGMASPAPDFHPVPVIAHYNGTTWSVTKTPVPPSSSLATLTDIDMTSPTNGWAVGWRTNSPTAPSQSLAMHWQNNRWTTTTLPQIAGISALLNSVHAQAGNNNDVWAVGSQGDSALVMHFNGTQWTQQPVPQPGTTDAFNELQAVTTTATNDVWAVGATCTPITDGATCKPLILHLSNNTWQLIPTADTQGTNLRDITARSNNDIWAVGYDLPPGGQETTYTEHWDGKTFTTIPSNTNTNTNTPTTRGDLASALEAITQIPKTTTLWAAGWQENTPQLIQHD
jgi:hypothetical protein